MANKSSPYIERIGTSSSEGSHQTSPAYVLTFVRWNNRDTVNYVDINNKTTRDPLVVVNDVTSIEVNDSKNKVSSSVSAALKAGDINYATAVAPGDYLIVNLLNYEKDAIRVAKKATEGKAINKLGDGFKGLYKVQTIRRQLITDPVTGKKQYQFILHAFSFTEFNTLIYYNPVVSESFVNSQAFFLTEFKTAFDSVATSYQNEANVQKVVRLLIKMMIGRGLNQSDLSLPPSQNAQFVVPPTLRGLLGRPKAKVVTDIYNFILGIWKPSTVSQGTLPKNGFNPNIVRYKNDANFFEIKGGASTKLQGWKVFGFQDFNQKTIWSILSNYMNGSINESYTTNRLDIDGNVNPTVVFRQKPFNSAHFEAPSTVNGEKDGKAPKQIPHTKFKDLPRWKISPELIYSMDLGKDEIARINFLQLFGRATYVNQQINHGLQADNIFYDPEDIRRHGLKPAVMTANFDFPNFHAENTIPKLQAKQWAYLLFDMLNAGQLRESGAIECAGIQDPICVGDNLEFDGNIYHIEHVRHSMILFPDGRKTFRTSLKLSFGTSIDSTNKKPIYPQMDNIDTIDERARDVEDEGILPGYSDTQDLPGSKNRDRGEKIKKVKTSGFTSPAVNKAGRKRFGTVKFNEKKKSKDKK